MIAMATYCISDIHGRYSETMRLLEAAGVSDSDRVFVLGDIVDRGPETRRCLRWAMDAPPNFTFLLGNHEDMLASYLAMFAHGGPSVHWQAVSDHPWSYNTSRTESQLLFDTVVFGEHERLRRWYAGEVLPWIQSLPLYATARTACADGAERDFLMVHAGVESNRRLFSDSLAAYKGSRIGHVAVPLFGSQDAQKMLWLRHGYIDGMDAEPLPYHIVSGHTPMHAGTCARVRAAAEIYGVPHDVRVGHVCHVGHRHLADCGSCYRSSHRNLDLGLLRLDDMAAFYAKKGGPFYPSNDYMTWYNADGATPCTDAR